MKIKKEVSIGTVPYILEKHNIKYLIIYTKTGYWEFPKGHIEPGEEHFETLKRELHEEVNVCSYTVLEDFLHTFVITPRKGVEQTIINYVVHLHDNKPKVSDEHKEYKFVTYEEAMDLFIFDNLKQLLKKAHQFISKKHEI